jgi:hypothetical protein
MSSLTGFHIKIEICSGIYKFRIVSASFALGCFFWTLLPAACLGSFGHLIASVHFPNATAEAENPMYYMWALGLVIQQVTLQTRSVLFIPKNETARPHLKFPHSCICERFKYSHDWSQIHEFRNWERARAVSFLEIFVSNFRNSAFAVHTPTGTALHGLAVCRHPKAPQIFVQYADA